MNGKCYNCDHEGEHEWFWLVTDSKDDSIAHATHCMTDEEYEMGDTHTEIYCCALCNAEQ